MPAITTRGAASAKGFGFTGGSAPVVYIEDVFSTYLYTGTGSTLTITNGIDLSTKGGLTWIKGRNAATGHRLTDTARGVTKSLASETTAAEVTESTGLTAFGTTGFTIGADADYNTSAATYVSWTFRKQPKFFDIVTYTGDGTTTRFISHNLVSAPRFVVSKATSTTGNWNAYHANATGDLILDSTAPQNPSGNVIMQGANTTHFLVNNVANTNGVTYIAYLFASNAGGFGLTGADNVISCGSWSEGANVEVNLGYEPQFVLCKNATDAAFNGSWQIADTMRGLTVNTSGNTQALYANTSASETTSTGYIRITSTGFITNNNATGGDKMIYIAIRRGPMKVPTVGTSVFSPVARTGTDVNTVISGIGFATDLFIGKYRGYTNGPYAFDRLRGATATSVNVRLSTLTGAEISGQDSMVGLGNTSVTVGVDTYAYNTNNSISTLINYFFGRAPSFLDIVCDTGTGVSHTVTHKLGVAPELILRKVRSAGSSWSVYYGSAGNYLQLDTTAASAADATIWDNTVPTASVFSVGGSNLIANASGYTYVSYLFATCARVSKVGTYTGNGSNQTIDCGFTAGSRFVMIKRTSAAGDWYVWDSARGIVAGNDPHISFNTTAVEVTTDDSVDTDNSGFIVNQDAATNINVTSATYIFLAIA